MTLFFSQLTYVPPLTCSNGPSMREIEEVQHLEAQASRAALKSKPKHSACEQHCEAHSSRVMPSSQVMSCPLIREESKQLNVAHWLETVIGPML